MSVYFVLQFHCHDLGKLLSNQELLMPFMDVMKKNGGLKFLQFFLTLGVYSPFYTLIPHNIIILSLSGCLVGLRAVKEHS